MWLGKRRVKDAVLHPTEEAMMIQLLYGSAATILSGSTNVTMTTSKNVTFERIHARSH